jgi:hypothetical protein
MDEDEVNHLNNRLVVKRAPSHEVQNARLGGNMNQPKPII